MPGSFILGNPGDSWVNDSGKVVYQFVASLINTCGACLQYHLAIGPWWPIPLHRGCNCNQVALMPGDSSQPFADFRQILEDLSPAEQEAAVGKSAWKLIEEGVVKFEDVVSPTHVLTLQEVVAEQGLTVEQMTEAGVKPWIAENAFDAANTPLSILNEQRRQALLESIRGAGMSDEQIRELVGRAITERIGLSGPSGDIVMPPPTTDLPPDLLLLLERYDIPPSWRPQPGLSPKDLAEKQAGVEFVPNAIAEDNPDYVTITIDVGKVEKDWSKSDLYVGPGGSGTASGTGRYDDFEQFLADARESGQSIEQPRAGLDADGMINLSDGRNRFAVFRDEGQKLLPISVPRDEAEAILAKYGPEKPE